MTGQGRSELTVADLVKRYVADPDKARLRSIKEIKRRLDRNALPTIGSIRLAQLTRRDVRDVTDRIMRRGARTQARQHLQGFIRRPALGRAQRIPAA